VENSVSARGIEMAKQRGMMHLDDAAVLPQGDYTFSRYVDAAKTFRGSLEEHLPNEVSGDP
jgi:hypothetical protein